MADVTYLGNPNLKKANVQQSWTKKELKEYSLCMEDPQYFIENYVKIISLDEGLIPFKMYVTFLDAIVFFTQRKVQRTKRVQMYFDFNSCLGTFQ